ncbi:NAD(P)/FAD-dependent oxidoreductase [Halorientalis regularis]|jgi:sarcosine oxidase subunit beta|uniref:Sarcosine oxidase subunit beta n=1 Tax=Halorientalis regularis TaxID=660518 RepID=A0A1G7IXB7_9EURY|nr:FAD-binding oxidoreductase [Halorientalis regularis]SDF17321.1 sarcosine oxidase subunit beta [Halorientalis regularis]
MTDSVAVVGGGAVGVTAARALADRGVDVTLFERGAIAAESTGRAAGICYDAFAGRTDAAVAARAMARFRELAAETRFSVAERPYVWLAREGDETRAEAIREQVPRMRERGRAVELLDPGALAAEFPALRTDDVAVAAVARDAGCADPAEYAAVMAERAREAGAAIRTETEVGLTDGPAVVTPDGTVEFDAVLVAAGAHTRSLLADAGVAVPIKAYRVQALVTEPIPASERVPTLYDATAGFYWRAREGSLLVGDGVEKRDFDPEDWDRTADEPFLASAIERVDAALAPGETRPSAVERSWAGLCTATPDRDPLVGEIDSGFFVAAGWHGHGFMRAPALGRTVAGVMLGDDGIGEFDPTRFDGDEQFPVVEGMTVE